jgi:hypothetical protein
MWRGRDLSLFVDRFVTTATVPQPIKSVVYEGNGTGGVLHCDDLALSLNNSPPNPQPNVGTTKDNELALSFGGKVFPFGMLPSGSDTLSCDIPAGDTAVISTGHSAVAWPSTFDFNFMTGKSPSWKRHLYRYLTWKKADGTKLEMMWRYEQPYLPDNGWTDAQIVTTDAPGLIRVDISTPVR